MSYFPESYSNSKNLKKIITLSIWFKRSSRHTTDLANLQPDINRLDIDKLETTPTHLSNLSSVV